MQIFRKLEDLPEHFERRMVRDAPIGQVLNGIVADTRTGAWMTLAAARIAELAANADPAAAFHDELHADE